MGFWSFLRAKQSAATDAGKRTLLEFGWDEPDTAYLRAHARAMARSPFDGTVFHAELDGGGSFASVVWGRRRIAHGEVKAAIENLEATEFGSFSHNFLRFNTTPGDVDWFSDFSDVIANARLAGRIARAGRCRGILLDTEEYEAPLFTYRKQRHAKKKTFEAYSDQARKRGREIMKAFQALCPGLTVLMTFGPSMAIHMTKRGTIPCAEASYNLLAPFARGLAEAARGQAKVVDGYELSYGFKDRGEFTSAARTLEAEREKSGIGVGFGLWLDFDWRRSGWDEVDPTSNYFTPDSFETSVRTALELTDDLVWIYAETPRWWTPDGVPTKLPTGYDHAIRCARGSRHHGR